MSALRANIRVTPAQPNQKRPDAARVQQAAERLSSLGFTVLRLGRFGVSVEAPEGRFKSVLGFSNPPPGGCSKAVRANDAGLAALVDQVEIAPPPQLLG